MSIKRLQRILTKTLAVVVLLAAVGCLVLYALHSLFGYTYDGTFGEKDLSANVTPDESITNIALFGLDTRADDEPSHSDCIMIVTIDNTRGKLKLTSIMRDSLVPIDGYGSDKINSAYFRGGAELAVRTINEAFEMNISHYVAVDMEQLASIIDVLDGVTIDVLDSELDELNRVIEDYGIEQGKTFASVQSAGPQELNGVQAMCYARIRKDGTGDDWGRVERQSIVLNALFEQVKDLSASKLIKLMQTVLPEVTTSLSTTEIAPLVVGAVQNGVPELSHIRLPLDGTWSYAGSENQYISFDLDLAAQALYDYIYNDTSDDTTDTDATDTQDVVVAENEPLGGVDYDEAPTAPATADAESTTASASDPASLAEEGGGYDPETGDYYDADGDYYRLDTDGTRLYYDQETYKANN